MSTLALTVKQEKLWRFIGSCARSPSYAEMQTALGASSKGNVTRVIEALEDRGYVRRVKGRCRSIIAVDLAHIKLDLATFSDADLIAELERRTKAALARADAINPIKAPPVLRTPTRPLFRDWRDNARDGTERLLAAIEAAGLRPA